jgi:hypothetical protein
MADRSNRWLARVRPQSSAGSRVLTRLLVGGGLIAFGVLALTQTTRFVPWSLWRSFWPLGIVAAGVLLLALGGRNAVIAGVILTGIGGLFLIGTIGMLLWWAATVLWPLALIIAGVLIAGAGLRALRGEPVDG